MIKGNNLKFNYIEDIMNFEIQKGTKKAFIFEKHEQGEEFLKILTGMKKPIEGEVILMKQKLDKLNREELFEIRKKIAIVFKRGGLISNLKTFENIMLPALYHKVSNKEILKKRAFELLREFEFKKEPMCKISQLTILDKRIIGIVRGLLMNPEIMIFEYPFDGISQQEKSWLSEKIEKNTEHLTLIFILAFETEKSLLKIEDK